MCFIRLKGRIYLTVLYITVSSVLTNNSILYVLFQDATKIFVSLRDGVFGDCEDAVKNYKETCHKRFKYARLFRDNVEMQTETTTTEEGTDAGNHVEKTADL